MAATFDTPRSDTRILTIMKCKCNRIESVPLTIPCMAPRPQVSQFGIPQRDINYKTFTSDLAGSAKCMILTPCTSTVRPQSAGVPQLPTCTIWSRSRLSALVCRRILQPSRRQHLSFGGVLPHYPAARDGDSSGEQQEPFCQPEQVEREPYLEVGSIITTHGVRGEVKVQALTDFPEERLLTAGTR